MQQQPARDWKVEAELLERLQDEIEAELHSRKYLRTHWRDSRERSFRKPARSQRQTH